MSASINDEFLFKNTPSVIHFCNSPSDRINTKLLTFLYSKNTIKHIYFRQGKKNKVVFATFVLALLET